MVVDGVKKYANMQKHSKQSERDMVAKIHIFLSYIFRKMLWLIHLCLEISLTIVVWIWITLDNKS